MSNVKFYGEHDAKTIGQMERCMAVGSAVAGRALRRRPSRLRASDRRRRRLRGAHLDQRASASTSLAATWRCASTPATRTSHRDRDRSSTTSRVRSASASAAATPRRSTTNSSRATLWVAAGVRRAEVHGAGPARHRRVRQPLCRPLRGRGGLRLDRRAFRLARPRPQDHDQAPEARRRARTAWRSIRPSSIRTSDLGRTYHRRRRARRPLRLCRPRVGGGEGARASSAAQ